MAILRAYVAAGSAPDQRSRARRFMDRLRDHDIEVTSRWIEGIEKNQAGNPNPPASRHKRRQWSITCIDAIWSSDLFVQLLTPEKSEGSAFELSQAITAELDVIVVGPYGQSIFGSMADVELETEDEALAWIRALIERKRQWDTRHGGSS